VIRNRRSDRLLQTLTDGHVTPSEFQLKPLHSNGQQGAKGNANGKLVIAVGGGPTAVINQSLVGAVLEARLFPQIERIYGARYGVAAS
jgi:hypothetical protein